MSKHRGGCGISVERQHKRLILVNPSPVSLAFHRHRTEDRGTAGREDKPALAFNRFAPQAFQIAAYGKAASQACREVAGKVVRPRATVDPAAHTRLRAADLEGVGATARVAERDHRGGEAGGDLADALHRSLRREPDDPHGPDLRIRSGGTAKKRKQDKPADAHGPLTAWVTGCAASVRQSAIFVYGEASAPRHDASTT